MLAKELFDITGLLLHGVVYTFVITLSCFATAFISGLGVAALRRLTGSRVGRILDLMVFILRAIPVLVLLFLIYFGLPGFGFSVPPLVAMNLSLGLIGGAYLSEVFRGALLAVDEQEMAAARASGFSAWQILCFIEFPQMLRFSVPGVMNELTAILKNTPFAYTVGVTEILGQAKALTASTMLGMSIYMLAGVLYFLIYKFFQIVLTKIKNRYAVE
ncbi:amino acid ABC transporter permease [Enterobacter sp. Ap-1006]|uniref:amino acid ABC transporter permease n=1 Tax=Enterobacter sp. Ap-1006 TaxID=2608345 RepID=UPI0014246C7B|nr:amino acid ABC transporter permease [Enterobacter sp. Ap-1006]NIF47152.1 amino acid ABC transporter permease [Enterobacter sp. Ap-1006]